jgi:uncharacterized protein Usg
VHSVRVASVGLIKPSTFRLVGGLLCFH